MYIQIITDLGYSTTLQYGRDNEAVARDYFQNIILPCGLYISETENYLAATPDGLVGENTILEIKCPYSARNLTPQEAIETKKIKLPFTKMVNSLLKETMFTIIKYKGNLIY